MAYFCFISFILREGQGWELSPAYDVTYAHNSAYDAWTKIHSMGVNGVFSGISRQDVLKMCAPYPINNPERIIDSVLDVADNWLCFAKKAGLSETRAEQIGKDIAACSKLLKKD